MSTRAGGWSSHPFNSLNLGFKAGDDPCVVERNRESFFKLIGVPRDALAIPGQIHSHHVRTAAHPGSFPETDALITDRRGIYLVVSVADCPPVFLYSPEGHVIAVVHSGWRGTLDRIAARTVVEIEDGCSCNPEGIIAVIGPSIGPCCYEVGEDVASMFDGRFLTGSAKGGHRLNLWEAVKQQLIESGLNPKNIFNPEVCTCCNQNIFYSHRGSGGKTGRMLGIIGLK